MGNCCDRLTDGTIFSDGDTERRPLLGVDGNRRGSESGVGSNSTGVGSKTEYGGGAGLGGGEKKNDEQSALNRILQTTADQVIDVGALDSRGLEQRDYLDRARQYSARVAISMKPGLKLPTQPGNLLAQHLYSSNSSSNMPPNAVVAAPIPRQDDFLIVNELASRCSDAVKDIVVQHHEDLVVPFGV